MINARTKAHLVKTPIHNITLGEAVVSQDGHYTLRIKKPKGKEIEELPLDKLLSLVVSAAEAE